MLGEGMLNVCCPTTLRWRSLRQAGSVQGRWEGVCVCVVCVCVVGKNGSLVSQGGQVKVPQTPSPELPAQPQPLFSPLPLGNKVL